MSEVEKEQGKEPAVSAPAKKKQSRAGKVVGVIATILLLALLAALLTNSLLTMFMPHYYPTYGGKRMFAIVTDSMEPEIPTGSMIVDTVPVSEDQIQVDTIITFEVLDSKGKVVEVLTHRVKAFGTGEDAGMYLTQGDNAKGQDSFHPRFENIIGIYTGQKVAFWGALVGWLQSTSGVTWIIIIIAFVIIGWGIIEVMNALENRRQKEKAALKKSVTELGNVNLRYDNIREITAVMDVLDMVTDESEKRARRKEIEQRLDAFIAAESIELPQTPETAALLDTLPAPDTPHTLASALRSGATLRQAEDGKTLILTGLSGGKSIRLTPVQTPDGIILVQQGVHLKSDIAPNVESMGATSMPEYPEFFDGTTLKTNVEYPELPAGATVGVDLLNPYAANGETLPAVVGEHLPEKVKSPEELEEERKRREARRLAAQKRRERMRREKAEREAYEKYRESIAEAELKQAAELDLLLNEVKPLTDADIARLNAYRAAQKEKAKEKKAKEKKPATPKTPEQIAAQKERAAAKKAEREAFLNSLSPADRELYLSDERLRKSRAATIRRLKKIERDRKLLEKL